jgi:PPOX class probable F420-dependent enzyme
MTTWQTEIPRTQIETLLAGPNHAVLGVNRTTGAPQLTVVWFLWDGAAFWISTTFGRAKYANITRDPAITLLIDNPVDKWYLAASGTAEIRDHNRDLSRRLFQKYLPNATKTENDDPDRVAIMLQPDRIRTGS